MTGIEVVAAIGAGIAGAAKAVAGAALKAGAVLGKAGAAAGKASAAFAKGAVVGAGKAAPAAAASTKAGAVGVKVGSAVKTIGGVVATTAKVGGAVAAVASPFLSAGQVAASNLADQQRFQQTAQIAEYEEQQAVVNEAILDEQAQRSVFGLTRDLQRRQSAAAARQASSGVAFGATSTDILQDMLDDFDRAADDVLFETAIATSTQRNQGNAAATTRTNAERARRTRQRTLVPEAALAGATTAVRTFV